MINLLRIVVIMFAFAYISTYAQTDNRFPIEKYFPEEQTKFRNDDIYDLHKWNEQFTPIHNRKDDKIQDKKFVPKVVKTTFQFEPEKKYTYTYNSKGNKVGSVIEIKVNNEWTNSKKYSHTYDQAGNQLMVVEENWNNNEWLLTKKSTFTYNQAGQQTTQITENWNNNEWIPEVRFTYGFDNEGFRIMSLIEGFEDNSWVNAKRYTYVLSKNNTQLKSITENWKNGNWNVTYSSTKILNNNRQVIQITAEGFEDERWTEIGSGYSEYDINGNLTFDYYETNTSKTTTEITYDNTGNKLIYSNDSYSTYIDHNNQFINIKSTRLIKYAYNNQGKLVKEEETNTYNEDPPSLSRYLYEYDSYGNFINGRSERNNASVWVLTDGWFFMKPYSIDIYPGATIEIEWADIETSVEDKQESVSFKVSPNPSANKVNLSINFPEGEKMNLRLYSLSGEILEEHTFLNQSLNSIFELDISKYQSGMYFINIQTPTLQQHEKLIIQK